MILEQLITESGLIDKMNIENVYSLPMSTTDNVYVSIGFWEDDANKEFNIFVGTGVSHEKALMCLGTIVDAAKFTDHVFQSTMVHYRSMPRYRLTPRDIFLTDVRKIVDKVHEGIMVSENQLADIKQKIIEHREVNSDWTINVFACGVLKPLISDTYGPQLLLSKA